MTTKVFVGNLAFQTTDQALAEAFSNCGQVRSGVIITRGRRSLGYGFVDFANPEDANRAVQQMHQTEFLNRTIKVELVRDPPPRPPRQVPAPSNPNNTSPPNNNNEDNQEVVAARRRPKPRNRKPRRKTPQAKTENQNQSAGGSSSGTGSNTEGKNPSENVPNDVLPPRRGVRRNFNNRSSRPQNETVQKEKIQSKTAVFVANLPFSVDDEGLTKIFEEFNVKTAHVVKTRTGRSRGYGFVDFASEKDQQAAIPAKHNKEVIGNNGKTRPISVTVSHSVAQQQQPGSPQPQQHQQPGTPQQQQQPGTPQPYQQQQPQQTQTPQQHQQSPQQHPQVEQHQQVERHQSPVAQQKQRQQLPQQHSHEETRESTSTPTKPRIQTTNEIVL